VPGSEPRSLRTSEFMQLTETALPSVDAEEVADNDRGKLGDHVVHGGVAGAEGRQAVGPHQLLDVADLIPV
jgi:hypothetical protein